MADSPLDKTAIYGEDPNWGRFTSAAGYSAAQLQAEKQRKLREDTGYTPWFTIEAGVADYIDWLRAGNSR